jgi:hypothetical protein
VLQELIILLKICDSETNLQKFHNGFDLQGKPFLQSFIVMEFITDDLQDFIDWYISGEPDNVKANESIYGPKVNRLQQLYKMARILSERF